KYILVINNDDEESVKAMNYNSVKETTADINILREQIDDELQFQKESLLRQENENERKFTNSEYSNDNVKKQRFNKTQKRILTALEIKRLLNKLFPIDPSLAYIWCEIFKDENNIQIIESKIKYLDNLIHKQLIPRIQE
ncbi:27926_t:CDS:2, partial [Gigaspora margarita]